MAYWWNVGFSDEVVVEKMDKVADCAVMCHFWY